MLSQTRIFLLLLSLVMPLSVFAEGDVCEVTPQTTSPVKVNINTATAEVLSAQLKGIGKAKAAAIVSWRETNGQFSSLDDLDEVKGIGAGIIEKNKELIIFKSE